MKQLGIAIGLDVRGGFDTLSGKSILGGHCTTAGRVILRESNDPNPRTLFKLYLDVAIRAND